MCLIVYFGSIILFKEKEGRGKGNMDNRVERRGIALLLVLAGIMGQFTYSTTSVAAQNIEESVTELNLVNNGDFETPNANLQNRNIWQLNAENNKAEIAVVDSNSFGHIKPGITDASVLQKIATTPGKTYKFEVKIKVTANNSLVPAGAYLAAYSTNETGEKGDVINEIDYTDKKYSHFVEQSFEFTAKTEYSYIGIMKKNNDEIKERVVQTAISIDDVRVVEKDNNYVTQWEESFSGDELNQDVWGYELGSIRGNEQQHYVNSKENVSLKDGNLILKITERKDRYKNPRGGDSARDVVYNSGSVRTHGKKEFLYGRIEMRAKLPEGKGAFPAFWTLGSDFTLDGDINEAQGYGWPACGEIDIMEMIGAPTSQRENQEQKEGNQSNKIVYGTPHFYYSKGDTDKDGSYSPTELGGNKVLGENLADEYHVYGINWSPDKIEWYIDDVVYNTMYLDNDERLAAAAKAFQRPQYIQLNLAAGGNWAKNAGKYLAEDDTTFKVDWVRWLQNDEQKAASEAYYADASKITGVNDVVMNVGETPDLLKGISTPKENYIVDYSVDDEYMFNNEGGLTNATLKVRGKSDKNALSKLEEGVYNIYYSAYDSTGTLSSGQITPTQKIARESSLLIVLTSSLNVKKGATLSSISLPKGFKWVNENQVVKENTKFDAIFQKSEKERSVKLALPVTIIDDTTSLNVTVTDSIQKEQNISRKKISAVKTSDDKKLEDFLFTSLLSGMILYLLKNKR